MGGGKLRCELSGLKASHLEQVFNKSGKAEIGLGYSIEGGFDFGRTRASFLSHFYVTGNSGDWVLEFVGGDKN